MANCFIQYPHSVFFPGDPSVRCLPREVNPRCPCQHLRMSTPGPAGEHQRDKMGDFFLWGYYNNRPVYQHYSGLDFLYFHKNNVWGVGPKIGGNSAGLLNFGSLECPYLLDKTPWEFGTKDKARRRQVDTGLRLECAVMDILKHEDDVHDDLVVQESYASPVYVPENNAHEERPKTQQ